VINIVQLEVDCKKMEEAAEKMKSMAATLPGIIQTAAEILEEKGMGLELSVPLEEICKDMGEMLVIGHVACRMIAAEINVIKAARMMADRIEAGE